MEFALVFPVVVLLIMGLINGSWLLFQQESVTDSARSAVREAALLAPLFENGTAIGCASTYGEPSRAQAGVAEPIEVAARQGSLLVPVNGSPLCAGGPDAATMSSSVTQQNSATVTVTASPSLSSPTTVTAHVTYVAHPLTPLWPVSSVTLTASSTETVQATQ